MLRRRSQGGVEMVIDRRTCSASLVCGLALAGAVHAVEPPGITDPHRAPSPPGRGYDEPDAAFELYRLKRLGASPGHDPVTAYRTALAHMDGMPRHSTTLGGPLPA